MGGGGEEIFIYSHIGSQTMKSNLLCHFYVTVKLHDHGTIQTTTVQICYWGRLYQRRLA